MWYQRLLPYPLLAPWTEDYEDAVFGVDVPEAVLNNGREIRISLLFRLSSNSLGELAFRVLAANNTPDFRTVSDFRKDHLEALGELFLQVLELCQQAGLVKLGHVALDGTKVRANASKHKAMSWYLMKRQGTPWK